MTREKAVIGLGILVIISPWSGLPISWLMWILPLIGLSVLVIGVTLHLRNRPAPPIAPMRSDEHLPPPSEPSSRSSHIAFS